MTHAKNDRWTCYFGSSRRCRHVDGECEYTRQDNGSQTGSKHSRGKSIKGKGGTITEVASTSSSQAAENPQGIPTLADVLGQGPWIQRKELEEHYKKEEAAKKTLKEWAEQWDKEREKEEAKEKELEQAEGVPDTAVKRLVKILYDGPRTDDGYRSWIEQYPDDVEEEVEEGDAAITLRYTKDLDADREKPLALQSVLVHSAELRSTLQGVLNGYPGYAADLTRGRFRAPFMPFIHRWSTLQEKLVSLSTGRLFQELEQFCRALYDEKGKDLQSVHALLEQNVITYELLDFLFEPGSMVVIRAKGKEQALRIVSTLDVKAPVGIHIMPGGAPAPEAERSTLFTIVGEYVDYDGTNYGIKQRVMNIPFFKGSRPLANLNPMPLSRLPESKEAASKLSERGRRTVNSNQLRYMMHAGFTKFNPPSGNDRWGATTWSKLSRWKDPSEEFSRGRVLIDPDGYSKYHERLELHPIPEDLLAESTDEQFTPLGFMLNISCLRGFDLRSKQWTEFDIDNVKAISWSDTAFEQLVLSDSRKRILKALVKGNSTYQSKQHDLVQGKGQGLVMLLCGPPGTGKTLTAEAIAESLRMPLYSATAGDLDMSTPLMLEIALKKVLELSARWNAVLLLDEADAFLEARSDQNTERNQQVAAVFLRLLKYYKGVLVLTTNREVAFDPAFHSRIHLKLQYRPLDHDSRVEVWKTFLGAGTLTDAELQRLGMHKFNGRRIKHLVRMAQLLAHSEQATLTMDHLDIVLDVAIEEARDFQDE
ncbi:hypothetical protein LTR17_001064 [Elasticomyces elasticus]|nr:hypothetical protein LTR17_001064 [Elasticomyces elasticus]